MSWTPNQKLAIESTDKPIGIIAGAGSGKTEVLTSRLLHLLKTKGLALNQILCITFTEKSAQELKSRIAKSLSPEMKMELPWAPIGTFHGFCLNILREQAPRLGLSEWFSIWDEHTAKLAIHRACRRTLLKGLEEKEPCALLLTESLEFRHALLFLEELMHFRWHAEKYLKKRVENKKQTLASVGFPGLLAEGRAGTPHERLVRATQLLYEQIAFAYAREKMGHSVLDFQDLEILTLKLFQEEKNVLKAYQKRFQHILVDEVQDINDLQRELIELLFVPGKNCLCIVGDPKQSIYRFRGANVEGFRKMIKQISGSGGSLIELKENFRSRPSVLKFINHAFSNLFSPEDHFALEAMRKDQKGCGIELLPVTTGPNPSKEERRKREAELIAHYIFSSVKEGPWALEDIVLLFQSLTDVSLYEQALRSLHIPYRLSGGRGFLNAQEVIDLLFCLKLMVEPDNRLSLVGLMRSPLLGFPDTLITNLCMKHPNDLGKALMEEPEARWLKEIFLQRDSLSSAEILEQTIAQTHYDCLLKALDPSDTKLANVEQLVELTRQLEMDETLSTRELLEYYEELKKRRAPLASAAAVDVEQGACQLMTIHAAKGLQFPIVILPDLIRGQPNNSLRYLFLREEGFGFSLKENLQDPFGRYIPSETLQALKEKDTFRDFNERKRLLYVALTRAKEKIVLPWHEEATHTGPWYGWLQQALKEQETLTPWKPPGSKALVKAETESFTNAFTLFKVKGPQERKATPSYYTVTELGKLEKQAPKNFYDPPNTRQAGETLKGSDVGNWVHAVLREIKNTATAEITLEKLLPLKAFELGILPTEEESTQIFSLIQNFLNSDLAPPDWGGIHECPFKLKLPNTFITGIIDYLLETKEGWILYDFKTDSEFEPERYRLQMDTYALALSQGEDKPVLETRLLFLKKGLAHVETYSKARLEETQERLLKLIQSTRMPFHDRHAGKTD